MIECFLTNLYSIDVMAPFCLEMQKRGYQCHMALDELFWKVSYGEHFDIQKAIQKAKSWGVKLNLRLNYDIDIAVTQWRVDWALFGLYKNLKAKISYGIGLNKETNFAENDFRFDYYFIHGDYEEKILLEHGIDKKRIIKIGFPKLKYEKINCSIKKEKPIITYLPTWDEFKCIDIAIEKLQKFQDFEIYVKPHPLQSKKDLEKLSQFKIIDCNIKSIVNFSDFIVGDLKSGAIFDVIYHNPKIPLIALVKKEYLKYFHSLYEKLNIVTENDKIDFRKCDFSKLKNYCFKEEFILDRVSKISPTINKNELNILKERLEKTYKDTYENNRFL
jgi:hypothetical protein